jgi:hypothetical protein
MEIIAGLPPHDDGSYALAGICNEAGKVYRCVRLLGTMELVELTARFNAFGFRAMSGMQAGKRRYHVIFRQVPRA